MYPPQNRRAVAGIVMALIEMLLLAPRCRDCHHSGCLLYASRQRRVAEIVMTLVEMLLLVICTLVTASRSVTMQGLHAPGRNVVGSLQH